MRRSVTHTQDRCNNFFNFFAVPSPFFLPIPAAPDYCINYHVALRQRLRYSCLKSRRARQNNEKDQIMKIMKEINENEFVKLIKDGNFSTLSVEHEILDTGLQLVEYTDNEGEEQVKEVEFVCGWASKTIEISGFKIKYTEEFSYDKYMPDSFQSSKADDQPTWQADFDIIDEDGDKVDISDYELDLEDFAEIDYSFLTIDEVVLIDYKDKEKKYRIEIEVDYEPNIVFSGKEIATAQSHDSDAFGGIYSGCAGLWTVLTLYETCKCVYICHRVERTRFSGQKDQNFAKACKSIKEVKEFFGSGPIAIQLYETAGI